MEKSMGRLRVCDRDNFSYWSIKKLKEKVDIEFALVKSCRSLGCKTQMHWRPCLIRCGGSASGSSAFTAALWDPKHHRLWERCWEGSPSRGTSASWPSLEGARIEVRSLVIRSTSVESARINNTVPHGTKHSYRVIQGQHHYVSLLWYSLKQRTMLRVQTEETESSTGPKTRGQQSLHLPALCCLPQLCMRGARRASVAQCCFVPSKDPSCLTHQTWQAWLNRRVNTFPPFSVRQASDRWTCLMALNIKMYQLLCHWY